MSENHIHINGINMYFEDHGTGYPLILIHGGAGTAKMQWKNIIPILSEHFRVIAPDCRGQGQTNNPTGEFSYQLMADDFNELIKALNLEKPLICGWSDEGQIALELGIKYPNVAKALVVGGTLLRISERYQTGLESWGIEGPGLVNFEKLEEVLADFVPLLQEAHGSEHWKALLQNISRMWYNPDEFPQERIKKISIPVLIVLGDRDDAIPLEEALEMYKLIPESELAIAPNSDHFMTDNKRELFVNLILDFLQRYGQH